MKLFDSKLQSIVKNVQINDAKINYSTCEFSGVWKFQLYVQSMRYGQVPMDDNCSSPLVFQTSKNYSSAGLLSGSCSIWSSFDVVECRDSCAHYNYQQHPYLYFSWWKDQGRQDQCFSTLFFGWLCGALAETLICSWVVDQYQNAIMLQSSIFSSNKVNGFFNCNAQFKVSRLKKSMRWGEYWRWLRLGLALKSLSSHLSFLLSSFSQAVWFSHCYWPDLLQ